MKKQFINKKFIIFNIFLIVGGISSIVTIHPKWIGILLLSLGILSSIFFNISTELNYRELSHLCETEWKLRAEEGKGNVYFELFKQHFERDNKFTKKGLKTLEKAIQLYPNDTKAIIYLCEYYSNYFSILESENKLNSLNKVEILTKLIEKGKNALRNDPQNISLLRDLGILLDILGAHAQARELFSKGFDITKSPKWLLMISTSWAKSKEYIKALDELNKATELGASGWIVYFYFGRLFCYLGDYPNAFLYLENARKINSKNFRIRLFLEEACNWTTNFFKGSIQSLFLSIFCLKKRKIYYSFRYFLNMIVFWFFIILNFIFKSGCFIFNENSKIGYLYRILSIPEEPEYTMGKILFSRGHIIGSEYLFRKAIKTNPYRAHMFSNLAIVLFLQNKKIEALKEINKAIKLDPKNELWRQNRSSIKSGKVKRFIFLS